MNKGLFLTMAAAAALAISACDRPKPGDPEEQPDPPIEEGDDGAALVSAPDEDAASEIDLEKLAADNLAAAEKFLTDNAAKEGVKATASGLQFLVLEEGPTSGAAPKEADLVDVDYVGTKLDGVEFDSTRSQGAAARFPLSAVADSWTGEAVKLMTVGDRYRFFVPANLAFGDRGTPDGVIGPNEALIYDVALLNVTNAGSNLEAANNFLAANKSKDGVTTTGSGLQYKVLEEGKSDGKSPSDVDAVKVHYEGTLLNGTVFDSSYARGEPIEFPLTGVIPGWIEGLQLMKEGAKFRFFIPPDLAYGATPRPGGPIGPNEALIFEVELIEVK